MQILIHAKQRLVLDAQKLLQAKKKKFPMHEI